MSGEQLDLIALLGRATHVTARRAAPRTAELAPGTVRAADLYADVITAAVVTLWLPGIPAPQGSKRPVPIYRGSKAKGTRVPTGKTVMLEQSNRLKAWRAAATDAARAAWAGRPPLAGPLLLGAAFVLPPFKSTRPGGWPTGSRTGDLSKLLRAVEDSLTDAGVWVDDRLVVGTLGYPHTVKRFALPGEPTGCRVRITAAPAAAPAAE